MKSHFVSSYRQNYVDMNNAREAVNTNHLLSSSLTPKKERPSFGSLVGEQMTRIQPILGKSGGAAGGLTNKTTPLTPVAKETAEFLNLDRS